MRTRKNTFPSVLRRTTMRFECVKGPFVNALPMTLSGIVKGINTLRARARARATVNRSLFFLVFFFFIGAIDAADGKQNAETRSIGHRMCLSIFLGLPLYFVRALSPVRYIKASENCAIEYPHCWQYVWSCFLATVRESFFPGFQVFFHFQTVIKQIFKHMDWKYLNKIST